MHTHKGNESCILRCGPKFSKQIDSSAKFLKTSNFACEWRIIRRRRRDHSRAFVGRAAGEGGDGFRAVPRRVAATDCVILVQRGTSHIRVRGDHEEAQLLGEAYTALRREGTVRYENPHIHKFSQRGGSVGGATLPPAALRAIPRRP